MMGKYLCKRFMVCMLTLLSCMLFSAVPAIADLEDHITRTETGFYYTVQKGDTLWDLSEKFSNSPWEWPELWHYNPQIPNPHLIYPGQKILIFKKEWEGKKKAKTPKKEKPVEKKTAYQSYAGIDQVGFIRKQAQTPSGSIFKSKHDLDQISTGDQVYIHPMSGAGLAVGDQYTLYRTISPINDAKTKKYIGVQHLLTGIVEITKTEPEFAIGKVVKSFRGIMINDLLMPYKKRSAEIELKESNKGLKARIIKGENDDLLIGENAVVFIDKGENNGVSAGQSYGIFKQETARPDPKSFKTIRLTPEDVGQLLVLRTEKTTATALITDSKESIEPGEIVRTAGD